MTKLLNRKAILVDTSVWINLLKGNPTSASLYFRNMAGQISIATCPVIVQEVLQGIKQDKDFLTMRGVFDGLDMLVGNQYALGISAAILYRQLRKEGITIRKPNDCLIAAYAIENKIVLLHDDKYFDFIASKSDLQLIQFS